MEKGKKRKGRKYYDYSLLFLIIFLVCFGLIIIYSSSSYNAAKYYGDSMKFLKQQGMWALISLPIMIFVSKIDYRFYIKKIPVIRVRPITILYLICLISQAVVLVIGAATNGSQRWIDLGFTKFQPSEVTKICVILFTSYIVYLAPRRLDKFGGFIKIMIFVLPLIGLVVAENFSTALIIFAIAIVICFVASRKKWYFILSGLFAGAAGLILIFGVSYRGDRINAWLNVETHPKGYQTLQGLYAIASGNLFGKGLGNSMQKLGYIPEAHNDMIFTVICEELGLVGAIAVILLYVLLLWRIFTIAISAQDLFGSLIATGVFVQIAVQVLINIAVVTSTIPTTGIPIPFISYGGTSLLVLMAEMGIVLSVSNQIEYVN